MCVRVCIFQNLDVKTYVLNFFFNLIFYGGIIFDYMGTSRCK